MADKEIRRRAKLNAKKESYFRRLQTLFDMIPNLEDDKVKNSFINGSRSINRNDFEAILDQLNDSEGIIDEDFQFNYDALAAFDDLFGAVLVALDKVKPKSNNNCPAEHSERTCGSFSRNYANLPPLDISKFTGEVKDWVRFRDLFTSIVINRPRLFPVEKLHYLINSVTGRAAQIVKNYSLTDENFDLAWSALKERYESDRLLANHYFEELTKLVPVPAKPSIESLQAFINKFNDNTISLQKMRIGDLSNFLFFSLAIRQLDPHTRKEFESKNSTDKIPTFEALITFVKSECRLLEITTALGTEQNNDCHTRKNNSQKSNSKYVLSTQSSNQNRTPAKVNNTPSSYSNNPKSLHKNVSCPMCVESHMLYYCPKYLALGVQERHSFVKTHNLCFNCLGTHRIQNCRSNRNCFCNSRHHRSLHFDNRTTGNHVTNPANKDITASSVQSQVAGPSSANLVEPKQNSPQSIPVVPASTLATSSSPPMQVQSSLISLGTACALIKNKSGNFVKFRLLIDCASTDSIISEELVKKLGLYITPCSQTFYGLANTPVGTALGVVTCVLQPSNVNYPRITANALVVDKVPLTKVPYHDLSENCTRHIKGLQLADPEFYISRPVDMVIGCDILPKILIPGPVSIPNMSIVVFSSIFGHILCGRLSESDTIDSPAVPQVNRVLLTCSSKKCPAISSDSELNGLVAKFWESEAIPDRALGDPDAEYCEEFFLKTHARNPSGRYIVEMPFKCDPNTVCFTNSRKVAEQRFQSLETRFKKNTSLKVDCVNFLKEYESLGHMKKATREGKYILPYFAVFNVNSITTPTRIVFDGTAKHGCDANLALNDILYSGPKLQNEVPDVLLNFRLNKLVFCCDISKMYRQILLADNQRPFVHILFRENHTLPLIEYELCTLTYGLSPSAYLSQRVLRQLISDSGHQYPRAIEIILDNSVVDDFFGGSDNVEDLITIKSQLTDLLSSGGFKLNKWLSNSIEFLNEIKASDKSESLVIRNPDDNSIKVLGIGWNPQSDTFFFNIDTSPRSSEFTKRTVLSFIARIYDPLGFLSPMVFLFKCLLKEIWLSEVDWDQFLPPSLSCQWQQCLAEFHEISKLQIPRCLFPSKPSQVQLLGFCDASLKGSAAVIYLRIEFCDCVKIFFLKSKTRVAHKKLQNIPRLELTGALLLSQLLNSINKFLSKLPVTNFRTFLFSDSSIVISWIKKPPHLLNMYVGNRISAILDHTSISDWLHIRTEYNIADVASRGLMPRALISNKSWFKGPEWAYQPLDSWPISDFIPIEDLPEIKKCTSRSTAIVTCSKIDSAPADWLTKISNFDKLRRVIAYVLRYLHNLRCPNAKRTGPLSTVELNESLTCCIINDQAYYFKKDLELILSNKPCSPKIQSLAPFIDSSGLIRVGGRLSAASSLTFSVKHPILLSNTSYLTHRIILYYHSVYLHCGSRTLQGILFRQFWIINGRQTIRKIIHKCVKCARFRSSTANPPMGNLPSARISPNRPFLYCAVDLAGPYMIKETLKRNSRIYKAYFALFVCFSVKAVHIEVLTSLTAECFIAALSRFVSRRGLCKEIYCDQATNFKGSSRQISEIITFLRDCTTNNIILDYFSSQNIKFVFNVPRAPFMNGLAESNIKNVKHHLIRSIGTQVLTLEEFSTVTIKAEAILNSRPLCGLPDSPNEIDFLTPGHFLIGSPLVSLPEENLEGVSVNRLSRWQLVSQINRSLWRRWEHEYLQTLQNRAKWFTPTTNLSVGQLVWIVEDGSPPLSYPLGRIVEVCPGKDKVVRSAKVWTPTGVYSRPVRKLAPLPIS